MTPRFNWLKTGSPDFSVEYKDQLYFFISENNMEKFMKKPQKYVNIPMPAKLPTKSQPKPVSIPCFTKV